ncbi:MAG TPA: hypothetical protein VGO21_04205, partial [Candidatus Paceibacterota bacterium]|nr:hypothetical protein [Candidatus Paceibacterota bacterium]
METQVSNAGAVGQSINLAGKYVAGRDIKITETKISRSKPEFSEINLEPYNRKNYLSPKFTSQLLTRIKEKKLIIVGGSYGFDKGAFVRHMASLLVDELTRVSAKEWFYSSDYYSVFSLMQEEKSKSIFVLNQIAPQNVNYNIAKLISIADDRSHFILISTDSPVEAWKLPENIQREYWFEIPSSDLYEDSALTDLLCARLNKDREKIKFEFPGINFTGDSEIAFSLPVKDIAHKLQVPHKIELFHKLILQEREILTKEIIDQKLLSITKVTGGEILNQWFHSLNNNEKIIALGVLLFDGLYDDQFFSAIRYVVNDYWHLRDDKLRVLDYCDLESVLNFYKLEMIDENKRILKSKFPNQRIELLKTVWYSHRRHLILVLPTLVNMIRNSVNSSHSDWEL